jgi:hypothetical protein
LLQKAVIVNNEKTISFLFCRLHESFFRLLFYKSRRLEIQLRAPISIISRIKPVNNIFTEFSSAYSILNIYVQLSTFRCRRWLVNILFFFLLPFACCARCCCCCCCSRKEKKDIDSESSISGRKFIQKEIYSDEESEFDCDYNEDSRLLNHASPSHENTSIFEKYRRSSETVFDVRSLQNPFENDEKLENDTNFIVNAINESHDSLCELVSK